MIDNKLVDATVLVTGGSGYIGGWMIAGLLQRGYSVRATLRDLGRGAEVRAMIAGQVESCDRLRFFAADLLSDAGWQRAADGADFILHVASPLPMSKNQGQDLVGPAREGTLRVLKAGVQAGVRRIVVTSSIAAAEPSMNSAARVDEAVWTDLKHRGSRALDGYARSKTLAERAAWEFVERADGGMTVATVLPSAVLGPVMALGFTGAMEIVSRMLTGRVPLLPRIGVSVVDVRDLVELHVLAMTRPEAAGERFLGTGEFLWVSEIAAILREQFGERAARVPTRRAPDFAVRLAALFDYDARLAAPLLGERIEYSAAKAEGLLGWRGRPAAETVIDCAESLLRLGILGEPIRPSGHLP